MKYFYIFLIVVTSTISVLGQTSTPPNSNNVFLDFVTKVYFNPTILLKTQQFKAQNNVQLQILPSNSLQDAENLKKFEKAMQKVIRFMISPTVRLQNTSKRMVVLRKMSYYCRVVI